MKNILIALSVLVLSACSIQAPPYKVSIENVQAAKQAKIDKLAIGNIQDGAKLNKISLRGSPMYAPTEKSYGKYIALALEEELKLAKLWSGVSNTIVSGRIVENDVDITGFSKGESIVSVNFEVKKNGKVVFNKIITGTYGFDSSFVGAIAIPNGQNSYVDVVQNLIKNLFADADFLEAVKA